MRKYGFWGTISCMFAVMALLAIGCGGSSDSDNKERLPAVTDESPAVPDTDESPAVPDTDETPAVPDTESSVELTSKTAAPRQMKMDTPQDTLRAAFKAAADGSEEEFVACFHANDEEKKMVAAFFHLITAAYELEGALKEAFGDDAAELLEGDTGMFTAPKVEDIDEMLITVDGDNATGSFEKGTDVSLVKVDGSWLIHPDMMEDEAEPEQVAKILQGMVKAMRETAADAGKEGATIQSIGEVFGQRFFQVLLESAF